MKSTKTKKSKKKANKVDLDETKHHAIQDKVYTTSQIETSITLLESPEAKIVLEALLFLSKYADLQRNNLIYIHSCGLLPKLLALFAHNICIVRVSLRLLSQLLTVGAAQVEINQEKFNDSVRKICQFYITSTDEHVKQFSTEILANYSTMGNQDVLLQERGIIPAILKTLKAPENDTILHKSLELFGKFIELEQVRISLPQEKDFNLEIFKQQMDTSEDCYRAVLAIFEKMTYFGEDVLLEKLKECQIVEHMFEIIINPEKQDHVKICLNIVGHCMRNKITNSYFITSFEFLKFCKWCKNCPLELVLVPAKIFLELSKIDSIKQMLFDLSIEDTILSFLRSEDKQVLNTTCEAISYMSKHKYCCEKIVTPVVIKKLLQILRRIGDSEDSQNEVALTTLHYFARRDSRTIHMIGNEGMNVLFHYLRLGTEKLSANSYRKVLEIVNMFVTNNQLQTLILSTDLYDVILTQTSSKFDEICMRSLEIMINCLNRKDFQNYFLLNDGAQIVTDKLEKCGNEDIARLLSIFVHNALMFDSLANALIYKKVLLILKQIPQKIKYRNPLIQRAINLIYDRCLPVKFFETNRLELTDKLNERFYVIIGSWSGPFPFLEVLEMRKMSTLSTIYVVDSCAKADFHQKSCHDCLSIHQQITPDESLKTVTSITSSQMKCSINYGRLSHDPYFLKYLTRLKKLFTGVSSLEKKIKILADFVDQCLCGPSENCTISDKLHTFKLHLACIKEKLGTNMIPIGYLRLGFHCERALLFKALADHVYIPATFAKGKNKLYWNEVALIRVEAGKSVLKMFVVDLMNNIGQMLPLGSKECNVYCDIQ